MTTTVMTGGSSGFGALTAERLREPPGNLVVVGARSPSIDADQLDLTRLDSVRAFAASVTERLGDTGIDVLLLNAGVVQRNDTGRTSDGYETTFAVNHLSHYLLIRLLLPVLNDAARVVLTTSGTHDPATGASLTTPRHANADLLAHPDLDPNRHTESKTRGQHAYTASKLCSVLTARWLSGLPEARDRNLTAIAYCPGQVFGTGLVRDMTTPLRIAFSMLGTPLGAPLRWIDHNRNKPSQAGHALANLALAQVTPPDGRTYAALRRGRITWPDPSDLARIDDVAGRLWVDSARLVRLPSEL